jgi:S-formylglutathione hydrolase FrmB
MGGYGAMRIGLLNPGRYAAIGAFSGALDMANMVRAAAGTPSRSFFTPVFGEDLAIPDDADLIKVVANAVPRYREYSQRIFITSGKQDEENYHIHTQNQTFIAAARKAGLDLTYREWDGVHVWQVWDRSLAEFIGFIEGSGYGEEKRNDWKSESNG